MQEYALELGYKFPYVVDEDQKAAKEFTAQCTPDFFLFDNTQSLVYRGQLDNSRPGNDQPVTGDSLRSAVDAMLSGQDPLQTQLPSMGCNIKWRVDEEPDYFLKLKN